MLANIVNRLVEVAAILDEILRRIFIEGHKCFIAPLHGDPTRYLLAISQTCSRFRNISLSCSLLWARVYVEWSPKQRQFWVQRSGRVELDICAHTRRQIIHTSSDIFTAFYRWRSLCFTEILPETVAYILQNVAPIGMPGCPSLQSIDIRCLLVGGVTLEYSRLDRRLWSKITPKAGGNTFPNLRKVTFWHAPYNLAGMLDDVVTLNVRAFSYS